MDSDLYRPMWIREHTSVSLVHHKKCHDFMSLNFLQKPSGVCGLFTANVGRYV